MKLFVTSRPEQDIFNTITASGQLHVQFDLHGETNISDVRRYVISQLSSLGTPNRPGAWSGPSPQETAAIAERAGGLFIWASTACKMLKDSINPRRLVSRLVNDGSLKNLDELYLEVLNAATMSGDPIEREEVALILHAIITVMEPLSIDAIDELLRVDFAESVVKRLGSVLSFGSRAQPVRILHPTFLEFLTSAERCPDLVIHADTAQTHGRLSEACFHILRRLHRDICDIGDASLLNSEIPNLKEKVAQAFPETLRYACRFWLYHTAGSGHKSEVLDSALEVFKVHFLHWLEALSLMERSNEGAWALLHLKTRLKVNYEAHNDLQIWCRDALRFVQVHQHVIQNCALQVYISALAFTPYSVSISHCYADQEQHVPLVLHGKDLAWTTCLTLKGHTYIIWSVTFSPDGTRIASSSFDRTIRIWDAVSGSPVGAALEGHTDFVKCVAFSPNGTLLVSGSDDKTIRLWNAATGSPTGSVLTGHTDAVNCVEFSPDGTLIASGSSDKTIRFWDAMSGSASGTPLEGHEYGVSCVTFSPNGTLLASGSFDVGIFIWDVMARSVVGAIITGQDLGWTIKFSPDGSRIASGSDQQICVWDVASRSVLCNAFKGHNGMVRGISFSPDGSRIASASEDNTVRIWDAMSGTAIGGPLRGHTAAVNCIAYSPDGAQIASGSPDATIRIWDATSDSEFSGVSQSHTGSIQSIVFSQDRTRVASVSTDNTIRIWEATSGSPIGDLKGLDSPAISVTFVPEGHTIVAKSESETTYQWELRDSAWIPLLSIPAAATTQVEATVPEVEPMEDKVELKQNGWVYQVGRDRRRLFYLPLVNRNNNNWGVDYKVVAAVAGAMLVVGSRHGHITIIDCSPLLK